MAILAFGQGISVPSLLALVSKAASASEQGHVMGVTQSVSSAARVIGPLFAVGVWKLGGEVRARGGDGGGNAGSSGGGGSGGAIRVLADKVSGNGLLRAQGGSGLAGVRSGDGGDGRIRVEADSIDITDLGNPPATFSLSPGPIFPDASAPTLAATLIMGVVVPGDPKAGITTTDIVVMDTSAVVIEIEATNVPLGTVVDVVIVPNGGPGFTVQSTPLAGTLANSTATASALFTPGTKVEIFLRADFGPASVSGRGGVSRR